jgi:uncharacterized membrane protein
LDLLGLLVSETQDTQEILDRLASRVHPADPWVLQEKVDLQAPPEDPKDRLARLEPQAHLAELVSRATKDSKEFPDPRVRLVQPDRLAPRATWVTQVPRASQAQPVKQD